MGGKRDKNWDLDLREDGFAEDVVRDVFGEPIPIEVKSDRYALEGTRDGYQVYIETEALNTRTGEWYPSGISVTEADAYVVMLSCKEDAYVGIIVGTDRLRALIRGKPVVDGGTRGSHPTRGVLVPTCLCISGSQGVS